jgi:hypothetical protein
LLNFLVFERGDRGLICRFPEDKGAWVVPDSNQTIRPVEGVEYRVKIVGQSRNGRLRFAEVVEPTEAWRGRIKNAICQLGRERQENGTLEVEGVDVQFTLLGPDWSEDGKLRYCRLEASWKDDPKRWLPSTEVFGLSRQLEVQLEPRLFGRWLYQSTLGETYFRHNMPEKFRHIKDRLIELARVVKEIHEDFGGLHLIRWVRMAESGEPMKCNPSQVEKALYRWLIAESVHQNATNLCDIERFEIPDLSELLSSLKAEKWERLVGSDGLTKETLKRIASQQGSEDGPIGAWSKARLDEIPNAGDIVQVDGKWYVAVAGCRREGVKGSGGGLYARWVQVPSQFSERW